MKLFDAEALGGALLDAMQPHLLRGTLAGSARRRCAEVRDLDLVVVARAAAPPGRDLFGEETAPAGNALYEAARDGLSGAGWALRWVKANLEHPVPWHVLPGARRWCGWLDPQNVKVEIYLTEPDRWGATLAIRTGNGEFGKALVTHARRVGYRFDAGGLVDRDGAPVPVPDEQELFRLLRLEYVSPERRTGPEALRARRK